MVAPKKWPHGGAQNGHPGPLFGKNLKNEVFSPFFDSRVLITSKSPFYGYWVGGVPETGWCPKMPKSAPKPILARSPFWASWPGVQNPPEILY